MPLIVAGPVSFGENNLETPNHSRDQLSLQLTSTTKSTRDLLRIWFSPRSMTHSAPEINFDMTPYLELRDSLMKIGIHCGVNNRHQITVSTQDREIWPNNGNSFWITFATGRWHLFTWLSVGYRVPIGSNLTELCRQCMAFSNTAMYRVHQTIIDSFGLIELDEEETELVCAAMKRAK